jgi:hypothetical protein
MENDATANEGRLMLKEWSDREPDPPSRKTGRIILAIVIGGGALIMLTQLLMMGAAWLIGD